MTQRTLLLKITDRRLIRKLCSLILSALVFGVGPTIRKKNGLDYECVIRNMDELAKEFQGDRINRIENVFMLGHSSVLIQVAHSYRSVSTGHRL
jgi:hypothetical protein